jgi:hypothetical protein
MADVVIHTAFSNLDCTGQLRLIGFVIIFMTIWECKSNREGVARPSRPLTATNNGWRMADD